MVLSGHPACSYIDFSLLPALHLLVSQANSARAGCCIIWQQQ